MTVIETISEYVPEAIETVKKIVEAYDFIKEVAEAAREAGLKF